MPRNLRRTGVRPELSDRSGDSFDAGGVPVHVGRIGHHSWRTIGKTFAFRAAAHANSAVRRNLAPNLLRPADRVDREFCLLHSTRISPRWLALRPRIRRDRLLPLFPAGLLRDS